MGREYRRRMYQLGLSANLPPMLLYDNFLSIAGWATAGTSGNTIRRLLSRYMTPPNSIQLSTRSASAAQNDNVRIQRDFPYPRSNHISLFCNFYPTSPDEDYTFEVFFQLYDHTNRHEFGVRHRVSSGTGTWYYYAGDGTWTAIPNITQTLGFDSWHRMTIGFNISTNRYTSLRADGTNVDMSSLSYDLVTDSSTIGPHFWLAARSLDAAQQTTVYIDELIVLEEPF